MKYVAVITDSTVASVVVVNDSESLTVVAEVNNADDVVDVTDRSPRPGPGWTWIDDEFLPPAPFPSWLWIDGAWQPPVPYPSDAGSWGWDEDRGEWVDLTVADPDPDTE